MSKLTKHTDICADCGSLDPPWAIVNKGLFVCDECCSIHRSLGRHVSQIQSLKKSHWNISQLKMIQSLNNAGINSLWEHSLDVKSKKKPTPKDPLHPNKAEFIRAKHKELQYVLKSTVSLEDLNFQLHSSVRTSNIDTSLRLLAQGADPNFLHPEKGNRALHVAAKAGQLFQVELLSIYGADPNTKDLHGNTPIQIAKLSGHREVQMRLTEMLYTVTDRLIYFLTRLRPDHQAGQHFVLPEPRDCLVSPCSTEIGKSRLIQVGNTQFEQIAMDVYDEVDRRETETIWLSSGASLEYSTVPFLPVDPDLSSMRNQGRQKLARLTPQEFSALILDILHDAHKRQASRLRKDADDEPLYDSVASDDDYASAEQLAIMVAQNSRGLPLLLTESEKSVSAKTESPTERLLREKLLNAQARESQLSAQIQRLNKRVDEVNIENEKLKKSLKVSVAQSEPDPVMELRSISLNSSHSPRPASMYETRDAVRVQNVMPLSEEVIRRTNQVTKRIQELWSAVRPPESNFVYVPCAERIRVAVAELTAIFPQVKLNDDDIGKSMYQLNTSTARLQVECAELERCAESVRSLAFQIADANRHLITKFK